MRRSKSLPEGGRLDQVDFGDLQRRINNAIEFAGNTTELRRNEAARAFWFEVYDELSEGKPGLLGAVTSRAEAQVMRLACAYALLDCSPVVARAHLEAALSLWRYCEDSARYIFGEAMGDPVADMILMGLREAGADGLTRTDISTLLGRNVGSAQITRALNTLAESFRARSEKQRVEGTTRPVERWFLSRVTKFTKFTKLPDEAPEVNSSISLNSSASPENQAREAIEL